MNQGHVIDENDHDSTHDEFDPVACERDPLPNDSEECCLLEETHRIQERKGKRPGTNGTAMLPLIMQMIAAFLTLLVISILIYRLGPRICQPINKILAAIKPASSIGGPNWHIIQSDNRDLCSNMQDYPSLTAAINFLYAEYHGYEYTRYQWLSPIANDTDTDPKDQAVCGGRASPWCKIIAVFDALNNVKHNDWVLFLDSDAAFLNIDQSVEQYISTTDWRQNRHNASFIVSNNNPWQGVCTGIWMVRNDEVGRAMLAAWWNCQRNETGQCQSYFRRHAYEQVHFNAVILPTFTKHVSILEDDSFVEGKQKFWKHVGSCDKQHRVPRFTKLLDATVDFLEKKIRMTIDVGAVVEEVRHHHTLRLVDQSPTQIELEHL